MDDLSRERRRSLNGISFNEICYSTHKIIGCAQASPPMIPEFPVATLQAHHGMLVSHLYLPHVIVRDLPPPTSARGRGAARPSGLTNV